MSQPTSGLLPALIDYYERLQEDPDRAVAEYGFSEEKIHHAIILEKDGKLAEFQDIRGRSEKGKPIPILLTVPDGGGRSGTGLNPFFCWDNTGYALGRDNKGKPERAAEMFAAFRDLHLGFRDELAADPGFAALCRFLEAWDPSRAESLPGWDEAAGLNVVFRLRARPEYVHLSKAVSEAWSRRVGPEAAGEAPLRGVSLISGEVEDLARLHPQLSGVTGANTTGAAIVSFNKDAFESYGKTQSYNAPVGVRDAFRYTTALNGLLANPHRRARIGDATVVFWSDRAEGRPAEDAFGLLLSDSGPKPAEERMTLDAVRNFLDAARRGLTSADINAADAGFYVLGLSPNASRLNVRYWMAGTVKQFADRLGEHLGRLEMAGAKEGEPPLSIARMVGETAREAKDIAPQLAGSVARAVLADLEYPRALLLAILRRVRADAVMTHRRASILKAILIRNHKLEVPVALNKDHPDEAYHLGRLFATLELAQTDALGDLNRSVKDAYFSAAASTPSSVFPRLMRLHQHHLQKLTSGQEPADGGKPRRTRWTIETLVQEICSHITRFPIHLSLEKQGLFQIAYYHQRQHFFTKKAAHEKGSDDE